MYRKNIKENGWDYYSSVPVIRKVKEGYELWEGYHRILAIRSICAKYKKFTCKVKFVVVREDCDQDLLFDYCVGMVFFIIIKLFIYFSKLVRNKNNNNTITLTFGDKVSMFKKYHDRIVQRKSNTPGIKGRLTCTKPDLQNEIPLQLNVFYL